MSIDALGNVGIGTTSPSSKLHISKAGNCVIRLENSGNGNSSGIDFHRERSTGTGIVGGSMFIDSDTANTEAKLYIQAQSASIQSGLTSSLTENNGIRVILAGGCGVDSGLRVETGASEKLRLVADGNLGIGTASPTGKLQVHNDGSGIKVLNEDVTGQVFEAVSYTHLTLPTICSV